jgi:hypothetical protein
MDDKQQSISHDALINSLVREIGRLLGKDASHLLDRITLHRVPGQHPNWGADIAAVSPYELSAFRQALESMLAL